MNTNNNAKYAQVIPSFIKKDSKIHFIIFQSAKSNGLIAAYCIICLQYFIEEYIQKITSNILSLTISYIFCFFSPVNH